MSDDPEVVFVPGRTILEGVDGGPAVVANHVVPLIDVMNFPGFLQLSAENMYVVANTPLNLQWLSYIAAAALASPSMAQIIGPLDEGWLVEQAQMQARVRGEVEQLIRQLLAGQP